MKTCELLTKRCHEDIQHMELFTVRKATIYAKTVIIKGEKRKLKTRDQRCEKCMHIAFLFFTGAVTPENAGGTLAEQVI